MSTPAICMSMHAASSESGLFPVFTVTSYRLSQASKPLVYSVPETDVRIKHKTCFFLTEKYLLYLSTSYYSHFFKN